MHPALIIFGGLFTAVMILAIFVPYLRRRRDLLCAFNLFLLGSANFIGIASIQSGLATSGHYVPFTGMDVARFIAGATVFYAVLFWVYSRWRYPRRAAGRRWRKWASPTTGVLLFVNLVALAMGLLLFFAPNIPGLAVVVVTLGINAPIFAMVFSMAAWFQSKANPFLIVLTIFSIVYALILVLSAGMSGRQPLLTVCLSMPIALYWLKWRHQSAGWTMLRLAAWAAVGIVLLGAYSAVRHKDYQADSGTELAFQRLQNIQNAILNPEQASYIGGDTTEASLAVIHTYRDWSQVHPFFTLWYVVTNPVPRSIWPDKPVSLGVLLPRDLGVWRRTGFVNWGPGVVGHGYYEGGMMMLVFYGIVIGGCLAFFDEAMYRQMGNPYLLAILCSISAVTLAFSRGDMGVFTMQVIGGVVTGLLLNTIARFFAGTGMIYPLAESLPIELEESSLIYMG